MKTFLVFCLLVAADVYAKYLDLAFVIDGSKTICGGPEKCSNWDSILQLIRRIVDSFEIGPDNTKVAVATFGNEAKVNWNLNGYTDKVTLESAIDIVPFPGGERQQQGLVKAIVDDIFSEAGGNRPDKRDVAVLFTDGAPFIKQEDAEAASTALQNRGITVLVVCITPGCNEDFARALASPPKEINKTYYLWDDFPFIGAIGEGLAQ